MFRRPDLALLAAVLVAMILILAVGEGVLPDSPPLAAFTPRPTVTASPTPGWWSEVSAVILLSLGLPPNPRWLVGIRRHPGCCLPWA